MFLHQTRATRRFLSTLTKFDLSLTLEGPKTPNLIQLSKWVGANVVENIIEFPF